MEVHFKYVDEAIAMATMYTANHLDIKAIITLTESGKESPYRNRSIEENLDLLKRMRTGESGNYRAPRRRSVASRSQSHRP